MWFKNNKHVLKLPTLSWETCFILAMGFLKSLLLSLLFVFSIENWFVNFLSIKIFDGIKDPVYLSLLKTISSYKVCIFGKRQSILERGFALSVRIL